MHPQIKQFTKPQNINRKAFYTIKFNNLEGKNLTDPLPTPSVKSMNLHSPYLRDKCLCMALFLSFLKLACTDSWHATIFWGNTTIQSITLVRSWPSFKTPTDCNFPFETSPEPPSLSCAPTVLPAYFYSTILLYTSDLHVCSSRRITAAE